MKQRSLFEKAVVVQIYADGSRTTHTFTIERAEAYCAFAHEASRDSPNPLVYIFINLIAGNHGSNVYRVPYYRSFLQG